MEPKILWSRIRISFSWYRFYFLPAIPLKYEMSGKFSWKYENTNSTFERLSPHCVGRPSESTVSIKCPVLLNYLVYLKFWRPQQIWIFFSCHSVFLSWDTGLLAEPMFCSEELSCLPCKNQNKSLNLSSGKLKFAVWWEFIQRVSFTQPPLHENQGIRKSFY